MAVERYFENEFFQQFFTSFDEADDLVFFLISHIV